MAGNCGIEVIRLPAKSFSGKGITDFQSEAGGNRQPQVNEFAMHAGFRFGKGETVPVRGGVIAGFAPPHEALVLEMVAAEAIAGYTFWLSHPYETNEEDIKKLLVYTLGMLE